VDELRILHAALTKQGRLPEASALNERLGPVRTLANKALRMAIENDPRLAPMKELLDRREFRGRFQRQSDGTYSVNFTGLPLVQVMPLFKARPVMVSSLTLDNVNLPDLSMLEGMELRVLSLKGCRGITDLTPLKAMKLQRLNLAGTAVRDLSPLVDMPLTELSLADCNKLTDISPLRECKKLEVLLLPQSARDIGFLREMKTLRVVSYKNLTQPVADFWKDFDAGRKK
jgi:hypothetical protein